MADEKTTDELVREIHSDVTEMKVILRGNPEYKTKGLVHEVGINTAFRRSVAYILGIFSGIGLILGALWHKITALFHA